MKVLELGVPHGLQVRVLPGRGLDVSSARHCGTEIAWLSGLGEPDALSEAELVDENWRSRWAGGLITTCGLHNVGASSEGHGLHGTYSHRPAVSLEVDDAGDRITLHGEVRDGDLTLTRTMVVMPEAGEVEILDVTTNASPSSLPAPILYHVNFGEPLWAAGARLGFDQGLSRPPAPRDAEAEAALSSWDTPPSAEDLGPERVFEHHPLLTAAGLVSVSIVNRRLNLRATVEWDALSLPRVHQWVHPRLRALAVEPANCSVLGRAADRASGTLPLLEPGEARTTWLRVKLGCLRDTDPRS